MTQVPTASQVKLKVVRGTLQKAGSKALERARDNTFHYPSPDTRYKPTSDEQLRDVLSSMTDRGVQMHFDGDTQALTLTFADDAALDLAMDKPKVSAAEVLRRSEIARDGALAFINWATALIRAYMKSTGVDLGEPIVSEKPKPGEIPGVG